MKKRAVALCGIAALAAATVITLPATAGAADAASARSTSRTTTHVSWKKCGTKDYPTLQCASLKVPLDHAAPHGRQITLALSRVPHTAKKSQGPLLVNPGGPGGSGLTLAGFVATNLPKKVAAQYDVIGFDPRGVGRSRPALDCVPGYFDPVRPPSAPVTPQVEKANKKRAVTFANACDDKYHDILPFIDTVSTVKDMDLIRAALGAKKLNYFGYSYGTYLGAVYAKYFPQRVRRLVLDSIVDPEGVWYRDNLGQDYAFNARHQAFMAWVAKYDATYKLGKDPAKIEAEWYAMRDALAKKPAGGKVGAGELEDTFLPGGYYNGYWPYLAEAFSSYVTKKDADPLVEAYENFAAIDASGDNGYSVYAAVQCRDAWWPRDWNHWRQDNTAVNEKAPFSTWNNAWYNLPCAYWSTPPLQQAHVGNDALPPVLLFQATDDAATPYEGGVKVHHLLRGSSLVVEQGGGNHGITLSGNTCLDGYLSAYLATGKVPRGGGEIDAVCKKLPDPKPMATKAAPSAGSSGGAALHGMLGFRG
ncbi:alpha/beta hydrolase [Streptomyces sp. VRA16 Mangrove soil]|uniref:alpha/beta hydrolase n=1 Tax=Streptomyces sp. VRA16 Mangrove soil TaxID=2817434 RepID=UPI001A9DFF38|nr:alpha/beta hydrolase [Streptomyces sp. VRA16 Mangrove soil]MBO1331129.1 alpha/beta fold hydrolase [Streptomyces sp. VRA16 Mangrove soil]